MLRKLGKGFLVLVVLLTGWIAINSIDESPRYDQSLLLPRVEVPDEQNGYALLRYLDRDGDKSLLLNSEDSKKIRKIIVDWEWDRAFAERVLAEHSGAIDLVKQVVAKPRFVTDQTWNIYSGLPSYMRILDLQKLVLLKARLDEEKGNYGDAIEVASLAMQYCEKIRMDEQGYLISYLIGWSCIANVTDFYHELLSNNMLSDNQLVSIEEAMSNVADYGIDSFGGVIRRQLSEAKYLSQWYEHYSVIERLGIVRAAIQEKRLCYNCKYSVLDIAYGYFNAVFARYYWHANEVLNSHAASYEKVMSYAENKCSSLDVPVLFNGVESDWIESRALIDFLVPGSASKNFFPGTYEDYVLRRCSYYNYYSAVKGIVAIARYRVRHDGEYPDSLQQLVPDYLKVLPEDFFGKNGLQYDPTSKRLYSVGINHDNSAAPDAGFYKGRCSHISKNPFSTCELSPAFPVSWNDYKFYEILNKAEDGDTDAQRYLGWMYYFGKYTEVNIDKAVYWYTKAAEKHDAHAENLLGKLYKVKGLGCSNPGPTAAVEDDKKSFNWFKKSYEDGSMYGGEEYAEYLISGAGGVNDFQQAARILTKQAVSKGVDYGSSLLIAIRNDWLPDTYRDVLTSAWADYYLQHPDLAAGFANDKKTGEQFMHHMLANNFWHNSSLYNAGTPEERMKMEKWASTVREHYVAAHDDEGIKELDKLVAERMPSASAIKPEERNICKLVFDHRHEDMTRFQQVQKEIFKDKKKADKLVASFRKEMANKYHAAGMDDYSDTNGISLGLPSIPIKNLLIIMFDFASLPSGDRDLQFEGDVYESRVMIDSVEMHPAVSINLILADLGLGAKCSDGKVTIYVEDFTRLKSKILTGKFIIGWSGLTHNNDTLSGKGELVYSDGARYKGEVANGLPNGKGEYLTQYESFSGDNFVDGMLSGHGIRMSAEGHALEQGEYVLNVMRTGVHGYGEGFVYETESYVDNTHSKGTITYFDVGDYKYKHTYLPLDHNYPPIWSFTGNFVNDEKTTGTCNIFKDKVVVDTFTCEFFKDTLVKVGDVSLLPPGMTTTDLQKYIP